MFDSIAVLNLCKWFEEILDKILTWSSENYAFMPKNNGRDMCSEKCGTLHGLVPFVQFKKRKNTNGGVLILVKL